MPFEISCWSKRNAFIFLCITQFKPLGKNMENPLMTAYFFNRDENIPAKGEIVHNEQFLLLTQCFH